MKFAHIINPVKVAASSDLYTAQPVTFASLQRARDFARNEGIEVQLIAAAYPEDGAIAPGSFTATAPLKRSVLDCGSFEVPRKLPLIADILQHGRQVSDAPYLIYSNVDIAVLPHFYCTVAALIRQGHDALVINRRTIPATWTAPDDLMLMYAQAGEPHPGYDCFVFSRELIDTLDLREICIGVTAIGLTLAANMIKYSKHFQLCEDLHLTFHLGDDRTWQNPLFDDYRQHNETQALLILNQLEQRHGPFTADTPGWIHSALQQLRHHESADPPAATALPDNKPPPPTRNQLNPIPHPKQTTIHREAEPFSPSTQSLERVDQISGRISPDDPSLAETFAAYCAEHRERTAFDLDIVLRNSPEGSVILEYGATPPLLPAAMKDCGLQLIALNSAPEQFSQSIAEIGLDLRKYDVKHEPLPLPDDSVNMVVFRGSFEQPGSNPGFTLGQILRVLKPGGQLLLSTQNLRSIQGIYDLLVHSRSHSDRSDQFAIPGQPELPGPVCEYTTLGTTRLLQQCGFRVTHIIHRGRFKHWIQNQIIRALPGLRRSATVIAEKPVSAKP